MKGVKGKLMNQLKTIKSIAYLKPERFLQVNAVDHRFSNSSFLTLPRPDLTPIQEEPAVKMGENHRQAQEQDVVAVSELIKDLDEQESELETGFDDKENICSESKDEIPQASTDNPSFSWRGKDEYRDLRKDIVVPLPELDVSSFRRPDMDSGTLFDPNLLAAFEQAVMEVRAQEGERRSRNVQRIYSYPPPKDDQDEEPPLKARKIEELPDPLHKFEEKCPPGGSDSVILYTTGLRGIRKTFEDCHRLRSLLENLKILFSERDISMHSGFKEELWVILGRKEVPPRLFIKGRYIGGAEEVVALHELGKLRPLLEGIPMDKSEGACEGCGGIRFIVCFNCSGSHRIVVGGADFESVVCCDCNENGVIICPFCC